MNDIDFGKVFSFDGRIGRKTFWQMGLISFVINLAIYIPFFFASKSDGLAIIVSLAAIALYVALAFAGLATTVKRLHDRGKSGWFYFVGLIPFIGVIWLLIEVGFRPSVEGSNQYGHPGSGSPFAGDAVTAYAPATGWTTGD